MLAGIFWGTKTTNFYKNRSFWPQIQFFPWSFWVQFSAASGHPHQFSGRVPPTPPPPPRVPSIRGLRWCRYSTEKCLPDLHPPFVYVVILFISSIWNIGETNPSTKTSKILFSVVMPTFGKSCRRPWLHSLKNQSWVGSSSKFSKMAATRPARGRWAGSTPENLPVLIAETCSIFLNQVC